MDGILLADKPSGITSNYLVQKVKKHIQSLTGKTVKIGHTGTLDFFATGLMILTIGKATRFTEYFQDLDKEYIAKGQLGKITDTYDIQGKVIEEKDCNIGEEKLKNIILSFKKEYLQYPPPYSAKRVNGKRAYQLAKKGITPNLKPKKVKIYDIQVINIDLPFFEIKVYCSSGTYIRSLIKEIGDLAGCGAYTVALKRTKVNSFYIDMAISLDDLLGKKLEAIESLIIHLEKSLPFIPQITLDKGFDKRFITGQRFKIPFDAFGIVKVFSKDGKFLGLGKVNEEKLLKPEKVIA